MIKIDFNNTLKLHKLLTDFTGGSNEIRDYSLLDSALNTAFQTFEGKELYPSLEEKGARLGFSLIRNHSFSDGNKRIGILAMLTFLSVNGIEISCTDTELVETGVVLASGQMNYEALLAWLREHGAFTDQCANENPSSRLQNKTESSDRR